jgi:DNA-binding NtrC family response regulator
MSDPLKVLIIDDEEIVCKRLKPAIEKMGCEVETFMDPVAALKRIDEKTFDIVVTDVRMDEIDGIQVLDHAKKTSSDTRVIIITGYAMMALAREAMEKGAFDFISKPFKPNELREVILRAAADLGRPLDYEVSGEISTTKK